MTKSDPIRSNYETTFPIRSDPKSIFLFRSPNESDRIGFGSDSDRICTPLVPIVLKLIDLIAQWDQRTQWINL